MPEHVLTPALQAMSDAVLAMASEPSVEAILLKLVHSARTLAGARYAALGVPDGQGAFAQFITAGMTDELIAAMGPLPRTHGLLGAMLHSPEPYSTADISADERFRGWWPDAHPRMRSFLGVPIVSRSGIIGAFYLTDKQGAADFDAGDLQLIEMLAAHAAITIENARLYERSRELSIVEERNRVARELHDAVSQKLFGAVLTAEAAATMLERDGDGDGAREQLARLRELTSGALSELRALIFQLRPAAPADEGLPAALRKHVDVLSDAHRRPIELRVTGAALPDPSRDAELFRIAQEALTNALRHAGEDAQIAITLECDGANVLLAVTDDGAGFDPAAPGLRARRLGLTSMQERAQAIGGRLEVRSSAGAGTTVRVRVAS